MRSRINQRSTCGRGTSCRVRNDDLHDAFVAPSCIFSFVRKPSYSRVVSEGVIELPEGMTLSLAHRAKLAAENPVAFVEENKILLYDLLTTLLGLPPDCEGFYSKTEAESVRRTQFYREHKGVFGHIVQRHDVRDSVRIVPNGLWIAS